MSEINYKLMFKGIGLYSENDGKCMLAVFSNELPDEISFEKAVENTSVSFVYADIDIKSKGAEYAEAFLEKCKTLLANNKADRGIIWITRDSVAVMPVSVNFSKLAETFRAPVSGTADNGIEIKINRDAKFDTDCGNGVLNFVNQSDFSFGEMTVVGGLDKVYITLCGENGGKIAVEMNFSGKTVNNIFKCGFEYGFIDEEDENRYISASIFEKDSIINAAVKFEFGFGVLYGNTMRFLKSVSPILCNFSALYGDLIYLSPVIDSLDGGGLTFLPRISENVASAPLGKYTVTTGSGGKIKLLCGFSGTEYIVFENNSVIEFLPDCPAFSSFYPEKEFSISDFVEPQPKNLLTGGMVTSWIKFYGKYYSQPLESPFFTGNGGVLSLAEVYTDFSGGSPAMPVMPYKAVKAYNSNPKQIRGFEGAILTSERNNCAYTDTQQNNAVHYVISSNDDGNITAATPSGFVGEVINKRFEKITLAFSHNGELTFDKITDEIRAAFSGSSMFCVIANQDWTGDFKNKFAIDDWIFKLPPGNGSKYNDYANIIIIKGMQGKIYDPDNPTACLGGNPNLWTGKEKFSKPLHGEQANLANWILNYCEDAWNKYDNGKGDNYYKTFAEIITNENWKGFIALNVSLEAASFPDCLKPLLAGLSGGSDICAHHIGSELVPLKATETGPQNDGFSPFFGLIRYAADDFYGGVTPIEDISAEYEFKLLEMNVLFRNGAVEKFNSLSQLVMGAFMGLKPSAGGCLYNALLLNGSLQSVNGHSVLMMNSNGGELKFESAPVTKTTINGITVISVNPQEMKFAFDIMGTMETAADSEIDVFSYDKLAFSGYKINLSAKATEKKYSLDVSGIKFDMSGSKIRDKSFCKTFGLIPAAAEIGSNITKDFKPIAVENFKTGTLEENAAGIEFSVNLGGLGSLSEGSSLTTKIFFAWDGKDNRFIGIKLPGASLIENVIGVTLGDARLMLKDGNLLLYISKVALQLLGMLKLPLSGALNLALAGNEKGIGWYSAYNKKDD